jgi:hypothetical protein
MGRPAKLTPEQLVQIEQRLLAGESAEKLGAEYGVSGAAIRKRFGSQLIVGSKSSKVHAAAQQMIEARAAIQALPPAHRSVALSLADLSETVLRTAEIGSRTAYRLTTLANSQATKIDDVDPTEEGSASLNALKSVVMLTKAANESSVLTSNLLAANKDRMPSGTPDEAPTVDAEKLSNATLVELLNAAQPR